MAGLRASRTRRLAGWLLRLRGSPEAIARGAAIGLFVALTPTVGVQAVAALALATLLGANRPVALVAVGVTNPVSFVPAYSFTYWLGSQLWNGPPLSDAIHRLEETVALLGRLDFWAWREELAALEALGRDIIVPLWIGGIVSGAVAGALGYLATLIAVRELRSRRAALMRSRGERAAPRKSTRGRQSVAARDWQPDSARGSEAAEPPRREDGRPLPEASTGAGPEALSPRRQE